jgi:amidohydrolase
VSHTRAIDEQVERLEDELVALARAIHAEPELAFQEHASVSRIAELIERHSVRVERPLGGLDTAFRARIGSGQGPRVAILAEYDALPEIGHACGHNLIAAGAVGAFVALAALEDRIGGTIELVGTPAEEGGGGKIRLIEAGVFDGVDAAMMFHPFDRDVLMHPALASSWLQMVFRGKPSHAAIAPEEGRSALTACMDTFRLVDGQRVRFPDGVRVHGIIRHGGDAVNIIPERAECEFSLRAPAKELLLEISAVVERCARGAATASDVEVVISARQGYLDMHNNEPLARRFGEHLRALGRVPRDRDPTVGAGSTDMGDVSHRVPAIHPWLAICDEGEALCHQRRFADCAADERGMSTMLVAAKSLARTAMDVLEDSSLRDDAGAFFRQRPA